ncbi:MAG: hypothetical protein ACLFM0_03680 [Spirochaetales bacterium]
MTDEPDNGTINDSEREQGGAVSLPCAPQPYAAFALTVLMIGLGIILFGLYATGNEGFPEYFEAVNGVGLALMCFGFSVLLDSRPPAMLQFDPNLRRMLIQESFFVRAMPSLAVPYSAIERVEAGEPGFRHRVPVRILLKNGGTMTFRIAGSHVRMDDRLLERLGLAPDSAAAERAVGESGATDEPRSDSQAAVSGEVETPTSIRETMPFAPGGESDATAGLLREFEADGELSMVWNPRAFGRAVRFRLLSVLSFILVAWALNGVAPPPVPSVILSIVAVATVWLLYRLARMQRQEYIAHIDPKSLTLWSKRSGFRIRVPRELIIRCGAYLNPDDPIRYLDIHGPPADDYPGLRPALDADGAKVGIRVPIGPLTYGEAIGLAGRIELALASVSEAQQQ